MTTKIYGFGWVGKAMYTLFPDSLINDPFLSPSLSPSKNSNNFPSANLLNPSANFSTSPSEDTDVSFVCVPTNLKDGILDCSIVEEIVKSCPSDLIIIRSTVMPGTCDYLETKYKKNIVMQPEYLGETTHHPLTDQKARPFLVLGGRPENRRKAIELYQTVYNANITIRQVTNYEAEVIKLSENRAIAFKVAQCQELYDACQAAGIDYYTIRDVVYHDDPRFNLWWTFVFPDKRGFNSKCILPDTKIYTINGYKLAKDLKIGDRVLTIDGSFQKVLKVFERYINGMIINIKPQGLDEFYITKEHPILSVKTNRHYIGKLRSKLSNYYGKYNLEWIDAENLEKGDFICLPKIKGFKNVLNNELMRLIGYFIAEGYADEKGRITFAFNASEVDYIEDIKRIVIKYYPKKLPKKYSRTLETNISEFKKGNVHNLNVFNFELSKFLIKYGGKYHNKKKINEEILFSNNISQLLTGFFRGDGSQSDGIITMVTTSELLFYQLKMILWYLKISLTTNIKEQYIINGVKHKKSYYLRIRNYNEIKKFNKLCGSKINKKLKLFRNTTPVLDNKILIPIKKIREINYKGKVFNYEIENNNTYVINDAIVHNCIPKDIYGWAAWAESVGYIPELTNKMLEVNEKLLLNNKLDLNGKN